MVEIKRWSSISRSTTRTHEAVERRVGVPRDRLGALNSSNGETDAHPWHDPG